ncbi:centromere protein T [Chanos chanos]|uniref:Centromere protein T n=1 Tax=Chanos chanos TaxID=29144 RepID=A0A6J2UL34_CHACN|nr:centromere protein T [Chanos chanos]
MDPTDDDLSARVLLRNVLRSEPPRSPITRSASRRQSQSSRTRQSLRLRQSAGLESPKVTLKQKLKQRLHESASHSPLPPSKRRSLSAVAKKMTTPAVVTSALYDDDITPRNLLKKIIQTEAEASLLVSDQPRTQEASPGPINSSIHSNSQSEGGSGLDLPDLTTENLSLVVRGLRRRRPPPTFNASAFERQLGHTPGKETDEVTQDVSAASGSPLSLTLKTPFVDVHTERAGLQRKVANRRQLSAQTFAEAVEKRLEKGPDNDHTIVRAEPTLGDSQFTLGLNDVTVPDLTTNIFMSNTALYDQPVSITTQQGTGEKELTPAVNEGEDKEKKEDEGQTERDHHADKVGETEEQEEDKDKQKAERLVFETERVEVPVPLDTEMEEEQESQGHEEELFESSNQEMELEAPPVQEREEPESQTEEAEMEVEELGKSGAEDFQEEVAASPSEHITRRAHQSGGTVAVPGLLDRRNIDINLEATEKVLTTVPLALSLTVLTTAPLALSLTVLTTTPLALSITVLTTVPLALSLTVLTTTPLALSITVLPLREKREMVKVKMIKVKLSLKTPAFIKLRRIMPTPDVPTTPTVLRAVNADPAELVRPRRAKRKNAASAPRGASLSRSYIMNTFKHFAKTKVARDVYPVIMDIVQKYFDRLADDLEAYAAHAKRNTIEIEDVELLMRRQGFVNDATPVNVLIEKFLPLEYRKLLIPVATSGNKVIPKQRR